MDETQELIVVDTGKEIEASDAESISESMLPLYNDGNKATYLRYRVCCFSVREATQLAGLSEWTIPRWRKDPAFLQLDTVEMPRLQRELSSKYLSMEFTRNFTLILRKDFNVLMKDINHQLHPENPLFVLSYDEREYLSKIRALYTPQQLAQVKQLSGEVKNNEFNFTEFTMNFSRTTETGQLQIRK
jgi:hypothetical protein